MKNSGNLLLNGLAGGAVTPWFVQGDKNKEGSFRRRKAQAGDYKKNEKRGVCMTVPITDPHELRSLFSAEPEGGQKDWDKVGRGVQYYLQVEEKGGFPMLQ